MSRNAEWLRSIRRNNAWCAGMSGWNAFEIWSKFVTFTSTRLPMRCPFARGLCAQWVCLNYQLPYSRFTWSSFFSNVNVLIGDLKLSFVKYEFDSDEPIVNLKGAHCSLLNKKQFCLWYTCSVKSKHRKICSTILYWFYINCQSLDARTASEVFLVRSKQFPSFQKRFVSKCLRAKCSMMMLSSTGKRRF